MSERTIQHIDTRQFYMDKALASCRACRQVGKESPEAFYQELSDCMLSYSSEHTSRTPSQTSEAFVSKPRQSVACLCAYAIHHAKDGMCKNVVRVDIAS